ncbi:MAG: hypothetical protein OHK0012_14940 [Synechococcales cyanobacterium]
MSNSVPVQDTSGGRPWPWLNRGWLMALYPLLWMLTWIGIGDPQPQVFGIPLWYLRAGGILLLLIPLNGLVVRLCWPGRSDD